MNLRGQHVCRPCGLKLRPVASPIPVNRRLFGIGNLVRRILAVCAGLAGPAALAAEAGSGSFGLLVDFVDPAVPAWPVVAGLPFPVGSVDDPAAIRLIDPHGAEVAAQIEPVATWRDGSLRWAQAVFEARSGETYRVEFGPGVFRSASVVAPVTVATDAKGKIRVDTGMAVYVFQPDGLLPATLEAGGKSLLRDAGRGAFFVDQAGRNARVAGPDAQIETQIIQAGPQRAVLQRSGYYVAPDGARLAFARAWFVFHAGRAEVRITHSLIFTEDTNAVWVRAYGLEFATGVPAQAAVFPIGSGQEERLFTASVPEGGDVWLAQTTFPRFLENEWQAEIGASVGGKIRRLAVFPRAGDWGFANFGSFGMGVVCPWLAEQFPKDIAFGTQGARIGLWSSRSGTELDFRTGTLIDEYWKTWVHQLAEYADAPVRKTLGRFWNQPQPPRGAEALGLWPSNAQAASKTHDVWLIPTTGGMLPDPRVLQAAARPPFALADPVWLTATEALGWPMHPRDADRFPEDEAIISAYWDRLMSAFETLPRTGLIAWGGPPLLQHNKLFRHGILADYGVRRAVWGLFARSGDRKYLDYGARFNRHIGDWWVTHWDAGAKFAGGFASPGGYAEGHLPLPWGDRSTLDADSSGHDLHNWLLEYYLTGDPYALHLHRMIGEAFLERWDVGRARSGPQLERWEVPLVLRGLASLYAREWDERFGAMAAALAPHLIDLDNPVGISDGMSGGALYKWERNLNALYEYYLVSADPAAKAAFLRALDYFFRFNLVQPPYSSTNLAALLYTIGYRWTQRPEYFDLVNHLLEQGREPARIPSGPHVSAHPTMGVPAALGLLADQPASARPFPVLEHRKSDGPVARIELEKPAATAVSLVLHAQSVEGREGILPVRIFSGAGADEPVAGAVVEIEPLFQTKGHRGNPRSFSVSITLPADLPAGPYWIDLSDTESFRVLVANVPVAK